MEMDSGIKAWWRVVLHCYLTRSPVSQMSLGCEDSLTFIPETCAHLSICVYSISVLKIETKLHVKLLLRDENVAALQLMN